MAASATFALKAGVWFRRGRLVMVSPDSLGTACPLSGRNSTYRPVQISETSSVMMSVAPRVISEEHHLDRTPVLEPRWWEQLVDAVVKIQTKQTDRVFLTEDRLAQRLNERFALKLKRPFPYWQTAHGDLRWANLTAPKFSIIDWETWGRAPYGFDVAYLHA